MQTSKNIYSRHNKGTYSLVKKIYTTVSQYSTKIGIFQMTVCQSILKSFKKAKLALSIIYSSFKCTAVNFLCCAYIYNATLSSISFIQRDNDNNYHYYICKEIMPVREFQENLSTENSGWQDAEHF